MQKSVEVVPIDPPPPEQRVRREARFVADGERSSRYTLPAALDSPSPVGYRTRVSLTRGEAEQAMRLLSMAPPTAFDPPVAIREEELFEEVSLGVLSSRQSTNYRGHRQITCGPEDSKWIARLLREMGLPGVLDEACMTHIVLSRPYRTPFTMLLTLVGHKPISSLFTVPMRIWNKRYRGADDIPTIGYLQDLHLGVLAESLERAAVLASGGERRANVFIGPFDKGEHPGPVAELEKVCGLTDADRFVGWNVAMVAQVGVAAAGEAIDIPDAICRKLAANLLAFRSERIQPGVNAEDKAPDAYQGRQAMDVPDELTVQAGRAGYNAFHRWTGLDREQAKELLLLDRIDVLTPGGKERLREVRKELNDITDWVIRDMPLWADLPVGRAFSRNANRGRKAFALAGQRIYVAGLSKAEVDALGLPWKTAIRALGAAAARCALKAELMGATEIPAGCDMLAGICLMAGPVNQNDIGKQCYGGADLLGPNHADRNPTSMLVWSLKAKTVADPIGNEEQLLNAARKGALVDLRPAPHEVVTVRRGGRLSEMRRRDGRINAERAFADQGNFVTDPDGVEIPGNRGSAWPIAWRAELLWGVTP